MITKKNRDSFVYCRRSNVISFFILNQQKLSFWERIGILRCRFQFLINFHSAVQSPRFSLWNAILTHHVSIECAFFIDFLLNLRILIWLANVYPAKIARMFPKYVQKSFNILFSSPLFILAFFFSSVQRVR